MATIYAFPSGPDKGMDLRDAFAIAALQGMLVNGNVPPQCGFSTDHTGGANFTDAAYRLADEALVSRAKDPFVVTP